MALGTRKIYIRGTRSFVYLRTYVDSVMSDPEVKVLFKYINDPSDPSRHCAPVEPN